MLDWCRKMKILLLNHWNHLISVSLQPSDFFLVNHFVSLSLRPFVSWQPFDFSFNTIHLIFVSWQPFDFYFITTTLIRVSSLSFDFSVITTIWLFFFFSLQSFDLFFITTIWLLFTTIWLLFNYNHLTPVSQSRLQMAAKHPRIGLCTWKFVISSMKQKKGKCHTYSYF